MNNYFPQQEQILKRDLPLTKTKTSKKKKLIEFKKFWVPFIKIFVPCFLYAFFRYTINHNEPWYDLPFYLTNKVFGVSSVIMMSLAYIIGPLTKLNKNFAQYLGHRKYFGVGGFFLGCSHGIMSTVLMTPNNYSVFYNLETGRLNFQGNLSMFFGTIALVHLAFLAIISVPAIMRDMHSKQWKDLQRTGIAALLITFTHIAAFGYKSWFNLDKWYGGMPPFSMVGASSILIILSIRIYLIQKGKRQSFKNILHSQGKIQ